MKRKILLLIIIASILSNCETTEEIIPRTVEFLENHNPHLSIGAEEGIIKAGSFESIWSYSMGKDGLVYVNGGSTQSIDMFDAEGHFKLSIGGLRSNVMKYPGWLESIAVDSKGNILVYSTIKQTFLLFSSNDQNVSTFPIAESLTLWYPKIIKYDAEDRLFILGHSSQNGYRLLNYHLDNGKYRVIHTDNKRIRPGFGDLLPDFTFDREGRIYITDTIDYKIYVYNKTGKLQKTFSSYLKKEKIKKADFNLLARGNRIQKFPDSQEYLNKLTGKSGYFPAIFGLNIDDGRIFVWTSKQDEEKKYRLDIFDLKFNYIGSTFQYNTIERNRVIIQKHRLFTLNVGSNDVNLKKKLGRFSYFNTPYKIEIFQISKELFNRR
jgi:hypothetical protein